MWAIVGAKSTGDPGPVASLAWRRVSLLVTPPCVYRESSYLMPIYSLCNRTHRDTIADRKCCLAEEP
jgi:hypothetical protein